jgi:hypothetical protein
LSFATPVALPATTTTNSVSSLSQSIKDASKTSAGKRQGPSFAKSSEKRKKSDPTFDSEERTIYDPDKEDKEADMFPLQMKPAATSWMGRLGRRTHALLRNIARHSI